METKKKNSPDFRQPSVLFHSDGRHQCTILGRLRFFILDSWDSCVDVDVVVVVVVVVVVMVIVVVAV